MRRLALLAACAASGLSAPAAEATTAGLEYEAPIAGLEPEPAYTLTVRGAPGETNAIAVSGDAAGYTVRDARARVSAGAGCDAVSASEVHCPAARTDALRTVFADAGDRTDQLVAGELPGGGIVELRGGRGDDLVLGSPGGDLLVGGAGDDALGGRDGDDRLDGGSGDDRLDGGAGRDTVSYQSRTAPVDVDLAAGAGGASGERDLLGGVEDAVGGRGADRLAGDAGPNALLGGEGRARDAIAGRGGNDVLIGHTVAGGPGDDALDGRAVSCGGGADMVYRQRYATRGPFPRGCERVRAVYAEMAPDPVATSRRRAVFEVGCRFDRCSGTLALSDSRGRLGSAHFSLADAAGRTTRVVVRLSRRSRERIATLRVSFRQASQSDRFRTRLR
jgi:hypothetical protein